MRHTLLIAAWKALKISDEALPRKLTQPPVLFSFPRFSRVFAQMHIVAGKSGFAFAAALAVLCLNAPAAHAQALPYWTSGWPPSFNSAGFGGSEAGDSFSTRYDLPSGWFVGGERGGLASNGFGGAWSNLPSLSYEGTQFGYNFKNADVPMSIYAGFGTLKYNSGLGSPLPGFDSTSSTSSPGYGAHAGVEFRPASNLSLSLGVGFVQQPGGGRIDSDINSSLPPGATPLYFGARR